MSDSQKNEATPMQTSWKDIVADLLILIVIMAGIGFGLKKAMDCCKVETPTEALCSVIRKGAVDNTTLKDAVFLKTLADGQKTYENFINLKDNTGRTPLMWASYTNAINPEVVARIDLVRPYYVQTLLDTPGIDSQATDKDGFTALHWAAWSGLSDVARLLISKGEQDINQKENNGHTPLMLAAMRGNVSMVRLLVDLGADTSATNAEGKTALQLVQSHHKAYAANESSLYTGLTRFWYTIAFWKDADEKEEALRHTKGAIFYFPLYKEARSDDFAACAQILSNPQRDEKLIESLRENREEKSAETQN